MTNHKRPIAGSTLYSTETKETHTIYNPNFIKAEISIDEHDNPVNLTREGEIGYPLYSANCACKQKNKHTANYMVTGPSGAGKSTWIDCLANHLLGVQQWDSFRYKIVDEQKILEERRESLIRRGMKADDATVQ